MKSGKSMKEVVKCPSRGAGRTFYPRRCRSRRPPISIARLRCRPTLGSSRRDAQPRKVTKGTTSACSDALAPTTNVLKVEVSTNGNFDQWPSLVRRTHPGKTPGDTTACTASISNCWSCRPQLWAAESQESPTQDLGQWDRESREVGIPAQAVHGAEEKMTGGHFRSVPAPSP